MEKIPELIKLLRTKSTMRYFPPNGTAGFARSCVSGNSRFPFPPASTNATILSRMAGLFVRARAGTKNQDRGQCQPEFFDPPMSRNNCFPRIPHTSAALTQDLDTPRRQFTFLDHHSRFTHRQAPVNSVYLR